MNNYITKEDINNLRIIDRKIPDSVIDSYVREITMFNLKDVLNEQLAIDVDNNSTSGKYDTLLDGSEYTYQNKTYKFEGLRTWYVYMTLYKFAKQGNIFNSRHGQIQFNSNNQNTFEQIDESKHENAKLYQMYAKELENQIILYLNRNIDLYPLWVNDNEEPTSTFKNFRL